MTLQYWYMFPVSLVVATVAMASGVEGATFFAPIFILGLGLPPEIAIGTGLITEVFGFASGLYAYARKKLIDYRLGATLLLVTIPLALVGTWASGRVEPDILKVILGVGLFAVAISFLRAPDHTEVRLLDTKIKEDFSEKNAETCLVTATGEEIRYTVCNKSEGMLISGVGGLFIGLISTGLGEMNSYFLLQRCRVPSRVSVATSVLVVAVTALVAAGGHLIQFVQSGSETMQIVSNLVIFTVPGVVIGGQMGSLVSSRISQKVLERSMGVLFILVAAFTLGEVLL